LLKGFDETFSKCGHSRYSYRFDELLWGESFAPAFNVDAEGDLVLHIDRVSALKGKADKPLK